MQILKNPPLPMCHNLSEMKENYTLKYPVPENETVFPPEPYLKCEVKYWPCNSQFSVMIKMLNR